MIELKKQNIVLRPVKIFIRVEEEATARKKLLGKLTAEESHVLHYLKEKPLDTQSLMEKTRFPIQKMNVLLTTLELKGAIRKNAAYLWEAVDLS